MNPNLISLQNIHLDVLGLDSELALYSLLLFCLSFLSTARGLPLSWSWPIIVKSALLALAVILSLTIAPRAIFATISWGLFIIFYVLPIVLSKLCFKQISHLDTLKALKTAHYLKWLYWGKLGQSLYDSIDAIYLYSMDQKTKADSLVAKWSNEKVPLAYQDLLNNSRLLGYVLLQDWARVVEEYEQSGSGRFSRQMFVYAARAYTELGKLNQAAECLLRELPTRSREGASFLATGMFFFFCSAGLEAEAQQVQESMIKYKYNLPEVTKYFWLAKLAMVKHEYAKSLNWLDRADKNVAPIWRDRIERTRQMVQEKMHNAAQENSLSSDQEVLNSDTLRQINDAWKQVHEFMGAQEIVAPTGQSPAVIFLIGIISAAFFISNTYFLVPNQFTQLVSFLCYGEGALFGDSVYAGEYWRLLTYLFLHVNFVHLAVNLMALYLFGGMVTRIYNSFNFLLIYLISGMLAGVAQIMFCPTLPCMGASGAVMGIFGAAIVGVFRLRKVLPSTLAKRQLKLMGIILALQVITDQIIPHIGISAHLGGLLAGMALAWILPLSKLPIGQAQMR